MATSGTKDEARRLIDGMPDDATWDDLMHEIHVRQAIEQGLADSEAGRTVGVAHSGVVGCTGDGASLSSTGEWDPSDRITGCTG